MYCADTEGEAQVLLGDENHNWINKFKSFLKLSKDILFKAGPISLIYVLDNVTFNVQRYVISKQGLNMLEAHIIARTIAETVTLPLPRLLSQDEVYIAKLFGAEMESDRQDNDIQISDIIRQDYIISILMSLITGAVTYGAHGWMISFFTTDQNVAKQASDYLKIYSFALPFFYIVEVNERILSSVDQEKWYLLLRPLLSITNLALTFALVPDRPLEGAAIADLGQNVIGVVVASLVFALYKPLKRFNPFKIRLGNFENMKHILLESIPAFFYEIGLSGSSFITSSFMAKIGTENLALFQVPNELYGTWASLNSAISQSSNCFIGQFSGAKKYPMLTKAGNISLFLNLIVYCLGFLGIYLLRKPLSLLYLTEETINKYDSTLSLTFVLIGLIQLGEVLFNNFNTNLLGTNDSVLSNFTWLLCTMAVTVPLTYISDSLNDMSLSMGAGTILAVAIGGAYWFYRSQKIKTENEVPASSNDWISKCALFRKIGFFKESNALQINVTPDEQAPIEGKTL